MEKSYVSMERKMCPVCGKEFDSGAILLDRRLKNSMERYTTTGYDMCEEHTKLWKDGYMALVVIDDTKSKSTFDSRIPEKDRVQRVKMEDAHRTGEIIHMKSVVFAELFNAPVQPMVFIDTKAAEIIKGMVPKQVIPDDIVENPGIE